ncbi:MAG: alpha/beta hydrolase [Chitinophagaceae bacterium]|nr:alpha/beta hydrolase [Chitinophagaceae bacterium]
MHLRIVILIALSFYVQAGHLNLLLAQKVTKLDTVQVTVDNHKMSMYVSGTGKYSVVLEAGGSSNHRCYRTIDTAIAKITRVISYDRPGYLASEKCDKTRDANTIAKELKEGLAKGGYPPPYILVGWSMGGSFAKVFCGLYPADVAGLVLLDPCPEDFYARMLEEHPELMKEDSIYMQEILTSTDRPGETEEMISFDTSMQQAKLSDTAHAIPTTLLIAAYGKIPGDGEKDPTNPMNSIWVDELKKWAASRPNLQYTVLENSGHHISKEHPDVVIKAIIDMIERIN